MPGGRLDSSLTQTHALPVMSLGLRGVIGIFLPAASDTKELVPASN